MFALLLFLAGSVASMGEERLDPTTYQLIYYKNSTQGYTSLLTTDSGRPVTYFEATNTLNTPLINNEYFMDSITHLARERVPERIVHAKGTGAFGYFEVTHDISHICKADFLSEVGKITPVAGRFSTVSGERGSSELNQELRGLAIKFYTREGNLDLPGINIPMYFYKDPLLFPSFVRARKRNPATNLFDPNASWDIFTLRPEALFSFLLIFSGRGTPTSYRHMASFPIHTYQVENACGKPYFVRFHIMPDAGIKNLEIEELKEIKAADPDYYTRDLHRSIANGEFPSWTVSVQMLTLADVKREGASVFDATKVIPLKKYPLHQVGKLVFNRNPDNFYADIDQLAFSPGNLVPGINGAPDKLFESRRLSYRDSQLRRLGGNFKKIPVNCPLYANSYNRDGVPPVGKNGLGAPNYHPNSYGGPEPVVPKQYTRLFHIQETKADNFDQARDLYANGLSSGERTRIVTNLVDALRTVIKNVQERAIKVFTQIHPNLGRRVALGLNITTSF